MPAAAWKQLLAGAPWFRGERSYPLAAYSEFMPPPYLGCKPYEDPSVAKEHLEDPWGWPVTEYEENPHLQRGLASIARQLVGALVHLGHGERAQGVTQHKLQDNPYWPPELAQHAGKLAH